jgi:hypothetical protein
MKKAEGRRRAAAGIVVIACAIVGGCNSSDDTAVDKNPAAATQITTQPDARQATAGRSELEEWAVSATSTGASRSTQSAAAQPSTDALAPPVIHSVD